MTTLLSIPTDQLLNQVIVLNEIKSSGLLADMPLTQFGREMCNDELSAIEAELDTRQPQIEFTDILDNDGLPVGFEPAIQVSEPVKGYESTGDVYGLERAAFAELRRWGNDT